MTNKEVGMSAYLDDFIPIDSAYIDSDDPDFDFEEICGEGEEYEF